MRGAGDVIWAPPNRVLPRFRIADLERQTALMAIAFDDARALIAADPDLTSPRGHGGENTALAVGSGQSDRNDFSGLERPVEHFVHECS